MPYPPFISQYQAHKTVKDFIFYQCGKRNYEVILVGGWATMTASEVNFNLSVPFPFRLEAIEFYHTDSAKASCTDSLTVRIERKAGTYPYKNMAAFQSYIWQKSDITISRGFLAIGEPYRFGEGDFNLVLNTTSTDLIAVIIHLTELVKE